MDIPPDRRAEGGDIVEGQLTIFDVLEAAPVIEPEPEPRAAIKPLTLEQLRNLEPFRATVWIENRDFGKDGFLELFQAEVGVFGRSIHTGRDTFEFSYIYIDGRKHFHRRVDEFYGREWRVWPEKPTDEEREAIPWTG